MTTMERNAVRDRNSFPAKEIRRGFFTFGTSNESKIINAYWSDYYNELLEPYSNENSYSKQLAFMSYYANWKRDTSLLSSQSEILNNHWYKRIIGMGQIAIPFLIDCLIRDPDFLFDALSSITGENPIKPKNLGYLKRMSSDWIDWAKENGYN